jgi:MFS family permease
MTRVASDRRTFVSLAVQTTIDAFVYSTYLARLPDIRANAGVGLAALGLIMTAGNLAGVAGSVVAPRPLRRFGSRRVLLATGPVYVLALPIIASSRSPILLVGAVVTMMFANAVVDMALAMQSSAFSARRERPVMSRLSGLYSLGTVGGGLLAAVILASGIDMTVHLFVLAGLLVCALTVVGPGLLADDAPAAPRAAPARRAGGRRREVVLGLLVLGVAAAAIVPLDVVPGEWATFRMIDDLHVSRAAAAYAYFAVTAGMTIGRLAGDHATAALGATRLTRLATLVSAGGLLVAATVPDRTLAPVGFFVAGLGTSVLSPLLTQAAAQAPGAPGAGLRALFVGNRLAGLLTPLAFGVLAALPALTVGATMIAIVLPCAAVTLMLNNLVPGRTHRPRAMPSWMWRGPPARASRTR